jgi:protease I
VASSFAIKNDMVNVGVKFVDEEIVVDRSLITSRKSEDLPTFMKCVLGALK